MNKAKGIRKLLKKKKIYFVYKERVEKNRNILLSILDVTLRLGRRNILLRGSNDGNIHKNIGNYSIFC